MKVRMCSKNGGYMLFTQVKKITERINGYHKNSNHNVV